MARQCPLCHKAPREGTVMRPLRLVEGQLTDVEPGLYASCDECFALQKETLAKNRDCDPSEIPNQDLC